ncbi:MFS transporter [Glycomyces harbinensis]|uniref:Predicted arabinose efflux permease, MFS family n=1 Tax=Glycomyces harbinensis TaxID=58114 RepID=A0A1G6UEP7_9ACTN|nr:MFS transporter [Glycomyces harbinensis]SDD39045.1 Predicted arabinose efflux permease, MFS family [Glycomyces harbinensis]
MSAAPTRAPNAGLLAVGIVALEFGAAVTSFVAGTLLPIVADDLDARARLSLLLAGPTLGLFLALPLAGGVLARLGSRATLAAGFTAYLGGLAIAATATTAWQFGLGQFATGLASGLLAVFGVSSAIRHLDERLRARVVAASSAMWVLPALVGPAATLAVEHVAGWRWALLLPLPFLLFGRTLILRAIRGEAPRFDARRPVLRTLLVPLGAALVVIGSQRPAMVVVGTLLAVAGIAAIMPAGTMRLRPGAPAALAALILFGFGYFGAGGLITILLTDGYGTSVGRAAAVLSAAAVAWGLTGIAAAKLNGRGVGRRALAATGMSLAALGPAVLAVLLVFHPSFPAALVVWAATGVGVGLAYPALYVIATAGSSGLGAAELAAAVITSETAGGLLGQVVGGAIVSTGDGGLLAAYVLFAAALGLAVVASARTAAPES